MDAVDPALVDQASASVAGVTGIEHVSELRIRWIGQTLRAEVDATVDPALTLTQAHDIAHHAEAHLLHHVRRLTTATIHISPDQARLTTRLRSDLPR
jgi:divalent metal cation (Fe/Co/Zn/Cd) transporter